MVPFLGVPLRRIRIFWGLYWGPPILGNYQRSPGTTRSKPCCSQIFITCTYIPYRYIHASILWYLNLGCSTASQFCSQGACPMLWGCPSSKKSGRLSRCAPGFQVFKYGGCQKSCMTLSNLVPWEQGHYSILGSCKISSINHSTKS